MAKASGISTTSVHRIWGAFGLQPHRVETFKLSTDPLYVEKVRDIVGLYLNPPERALVLCVDEKSQIQALDRTQPMLPMRPGQVERRTHDYKRHGTTTLFAALDIEAGTIIGKCMRRHRAAEFRKFLDVIERNVPAVSTSTSSSTTHRATRPSSSATGSPSGRAGTGTSRRHRRRGSTRSSGSSRSCPKSRSNAALIVPRPNSKQRSRPISRLATPTQNPSAGSRAPTISWPPSSASAGAPLPFTRKLNRNFRIGTLGFKLTQRNFKLMSESELVRWEMVKQGLGIIVITEDVGDSEPLVRKALPTMAPIMVPFWLTAHRELHTGRRIRVVYDLLATEFGHGRQGIAPIAPGG